MAKFSILPALHALSRAQPDTVNLAGGRAYSVSPRLELVSLLVTTFLEDEFYRTEAQTVARLRELIARVADPRFVAQAALYARHVCGMRSVSHLVAGELARAVKGEAWTKRFHAEVVRRPDDVLEILGYYLTVHGRPLPNSLKKGLGVALGRFDEHQLAKYRREHSSFKLVDAVNLVRPRATPALSKLVRGELAPADTWETALTRAGEADSANAVAEAKGAAWGRLPHGEQARLPRAPAQRAQHPRARARGGRLALRASRRRARRAPRAGVSVPVPLRRGRAP